MKSLKNMQVVVTGACGFIGPNLIEGLLAAGATVVALDLPSADWDKLATCNVRQIKADIMDKAMLQRAIDGAAIVYHLAGRTDIDGRRLEDYAVNYIGTQNIIEAAAKSGSVKRFVFYSTQLVVGLFNETRFIDETEPYRTKTVYGQSKIAAEKVVKKYCRKFKIPYTIIRPTSVYGPWGEAPYKQFFATIKAGRYFHIGKASNLVSWIYVKNLVNLTLLASCAPAAVGQTYFANDFHPYTMHEIVDEVAMYYNRTIRTLPKAVITPLAYLLGFFKFFGVPVPIYPFRLHNITANYCYDIHRSVELGYHPAYDLRAGITETLDWYEQQKLI